MASYQKRNGLWRYRVSWRDNDGVRHAKTKGGFRTKTEASAEATKLEADLVTGTDLGKRATTLVKYWHDWYTTYKLGKRAAITESFYVNIENTLAAFFQDTELGEVSPSLWQKFINDYGATHARITVTKVNGYVRAMVRTALNEQTLHTDFTFGVELTGDKSRVKSESDKYLQLDQFAKVNEVAFDRASFERLSSVAVYVGAQTGMRIAEVLGLTWDNVDEVNSTITVNKSWDGRELDFKPTKTPSSNRTVEVLPKVITLLQKIHNQQAQWLMRTGLRNNKNCVFFSKMGQVLSGTACNKSLGKIETAAGIPENEQITFHGLRHTHVSYLLSQGTDIYYISKRLGHSNVQITLTTYSHLLQSQRDAQASIALKALSLLG
ncbi:site-specific integrase [Lacticaseibacillus hulanensis]|uniref:site-specific integrase n=1 Tax=Lacticaseibacillus hulanensis TaxID=2493111 RepID=UPI0013E325C5|nr:site-specific integrase [Lacticaseibacillus hulanensis]